MARRHHTDHGAAAQRTTCVGEESEDSKPQTVGRGENKLNLHLCGH